MLTSLDLVSPVDVSSMTPINFRKQSVSANNCVLKKCNGYATSRGPRLIKTRTKRFFFQKSSKETRMDLFCCCYTYLNPDPSKNHPLMPVSLQCRGYAYVSLLCFL